MSAEGWAAIASIAVTALLALRQLFSTEFKLKSLTDVTIEGSVPQLSAKIKALEAEKLDNAKAALDAIKEERNAPLTATPIGQKVHDMSGAMTLHYADDDRRFEAIQASIDGLRKEQAENTATILKALATKRR